MTAAAYERKPGETPLEHKARLRQVRSALYGDLRHWDLVERRIVEVRGDEPWVAPWQESMKRRRKRHHARLAEIEKALKAKVSR